ncbi:hypothetical protein X777_11765 [Ooceraea biroi]|uniref:Uncharacterized protein n=1 Tax=Ooceraea biroi TaxID=2015173 RepID=A0A026W3R1_OOCBI|nr:hypothetical protein X777_11765 [Ooceraea biroi]
MPTAHSDARIRHWCGAGKRTSRRMLHLRRQEHAWDHLAYSRCRNLLRIIGLKGL